jgi:transitional endoplasmic reticulum ATPase
MSVDLVVTDTRSISRRTEAGLDYDTLRRLDIQPGEYVRIEGRERTVAFASRANVEADGVALGQHVRTNAAVEAGDRVTVSKVSVAPAHRLTVSPIRGVEVSEGEIPLADSINGWPVSAGDVIDATLLEDAITVSFSVTDTDPDGPVVVTDETTIIARNEPAQGDREGYLPASFDDIGGLSEPLEALGDAVVLPLERPDLFEELGEDPAGGVLLTGPSGSGKTLVSRALATEIGAHVVWLDASTISSKRSPAIKREFDRIVREARAKSPTLVVVDEVDAIAPADARASDRADRVGTHLRSLLDDLGSEPGVVVLGTAVDADDLPASLRRGGRFEREIDLPTPDEAARRDILTVLTRTVPLGMDVDLRTVAAGTNGFVGADLEAIVNEAVLEAGRRVGPGADTPLVRMTEFEAALEVVEPSGMREISAAVPDVSYDDIGGLEDAKREVIRSVEWPLAYPDLFERLDADPPRGVLLYGPPGTGKTMLAKAVANATDANFVSIDGPEVLDKYVGESERAIRSVFERARSNAPSVVFFDEIDAIAPRRGQDFGTHAVERVVSQLLTELDGLEPLADVVVLAATNRPDVIDPALLRPGRFEHLVEIGLPDVGARREIFGVHTRSVPMGDVDLGVLASETAGYTGSDIAAVIREASLLAIEDAITGQSAGAPRVTADHFARALGTVEPSASRGNWSGNSSSETQ